jgi:hypothetical protein
MRFQGRAEAIAVFGMSQLGDGARSFRVGLRTDRVLDVLEQDESADRVLRLPQHVGSGTLVPGTFKGTKHQSAAKCPLALRLAQLPGSPPGVTEARRLAAGGFPKRARRDGVAVQDDRSPIDPGEEDADREQPARRAAGRPGSWSVRESPDGESQLVEPRTVGPAAARISRDSLFSGQQGGQRGHHGAPRLGAHLQKEPGLEGRSAARGSEDEDG